MLETLQDSQQSLETIANQYDLVNMFRCNGSLVVQSLIACIDPVCQYEAKGAPLYELIKQLVNQYGRLGSLSLSDINKETMQKIVEMGNTSVMAAFMEALDCKIDTELDDQAALMEEKSVINCYVLIQACSSYRYTKDTMGNISLF